MGDEPLWPDDGDLHYHGHPIAECEPGFWECRKMLRIAALEAEVEGLRLALIKELQRRNCAYCDLRVSEVHGVWFWAPCNRHREELEQAEAALARDKKERA